MMDAMEFGMLAAIMDGVSRGYASNQQDRAAARN